MEYRGKTFIECVPNIMEGTVCVCVCDVGGWGGVCEVHDVCLILEHNPLPLPLLRFPLITFLQFESSSAEKILRHRFHRLVFPSCENRGFLLRMRRASARIDRCSLFRIYKNKKGGFCFIPLNPLYPRVPRSIVTIFDFSPAWKWALTGRKI